MNCTRCHKELTQYDIGFYKKLVNRGAESFLCIRCTSEHFRISEETAWEMIRRFQKTGCLLFPPSDPS
ncbi:MAG: hypothetical protein II713_01045 [Clostridia bacterium]|nr:hypothetical protein [Clostridia bacterium]